jgi:hypothetical protein
MDPVRNPAVCDCSINHHPFGSISPGSNPDCDFEWHAVCGKGRCSFTLRVEAGRCGSNRFNTDIDTELKSLQKFLNTTQKVFSPYRSHGILKNWHGLRCRSMRVKPGRYSFNSVWNRSEIRLCVTVAIRMNTNFTEVFNIENLNVGDAVIRTPTIKTNKCRVIVPVLYSLSYLGSWRWPKRNWISILVWSDTFKYVRI